MATSKKKTPESKKPVPAKHNGKAQATQPKGKSSKPEVKPVAKPTPAKKSAPVAKHEHKPAPAKDVKKPAAKAVERKPEPVKEPKAKAKAESVVKTTKPAASAPKGKETDKKSAPVIDKSGTIKEIVKGKEAAATKPVKKSSVAVFTLDDVRDILKNRREEARELAEKKEAAARKAATVDLDQKIPQQTRVLGAATLADILGIGAMPAPSATEPHHIARREVPDKFRKYYEALVSLREKIQSHINKRSSVANKDDAEASVAVPAQTDEDDSFDHDFALSLVANEQEALVEVNAAIERIYEGTYGICEITGQKISAERLEAVPFARYSVEGQAQFEMQNRRRAQRVNSFMDGSEESSAYSGEDGEE